jgi:two-component system, chemotaxis family, chemotaxis protein CheY
MPKVLSVDDSATIRRIVQGTAEVLGLGFVFACNGRQGLEVLAAEADVALICLDVNMPEMGGLEFLRHVKANPQTRHIPVIMVTSESARATIVEAVKAGAANYVCKPFTQEALTTRMVDVLGMGV